MYTDTGLTLRNYIRDLSSLRWCQWWLLSTGDETQCRMKSLQQTAGQNIPEDSNLQEISDLQAVIMQIAVAAWSKAWVCCRSLAGIVGSNPAEDMDVCPL